MGGVNEGIRYVAMSMRVYDTSPFYIPSTIALVGTAGAGKSTLGRRLAKRLSVPFFDSDQEVEAASGGYSVAHIYEQWGEEAFRETERDVIKRLLVTQPMHVMSTGDGAFVDPETRALLLEDTITIWLRADLQTLVTRVQSRRVRPHFLEGDPEEVLSKLIKERYPIYQMADIAVDSDDVTYQDTVERIIIALREFLYPSS